MKSSLSILLFCFSPFFCASKVDDYGSGDYCSKSKSKKIIVDFYADWNTACKEMDK